jgi:hypothetical protein
LRRIMVVLSLVAIAVVAVAPAMAQVAQEFEEDDVESGDVEPSVEISNVQNEQGVVQYKSEVDDVEFEGSTITFEVAAEGECVQTIEQAAASSA